MQAKISSPSLKQDPASAPIHLDWDLFTNELEFE
jgi:hypothetical protein